MTGYRSIHLNQPIGRSRKARRGGLVLIAAAVLRGAAVIGAIAVFGAAAVLFLARPAFVAVLDRAVVDAGFGVQQSRVHGHRHTGDADIRAALALDGRQSHLTFDLAALQRRVEALAWVEQAAVQRLLPDGVAVHIRERVPVAVWRGRTEDTLIDAQGRRLSAIPRGADTGLPVLTGNGAGPAVASVLPLLAMHGEINRRLVETKRIANRRWTLVLASGTRVHLPSDGMAAAIAWLDSQAGTGLLDLALETIDLRVNGHLVMRERTAGLQPAAAGGR